jgi:4-hydroxythreonine-4-phosphate dehydrogenase
MILPKIGITLGDPGGIGPEVTLKSLSSDSSLPHAQYVLFGSKTVIDNERDVLNLDYDIPNDSISLHDVDCSSDVLERGKPTSASGSTSFRYFEQAIQEANKGNLHAIVTAPISKQAWNIAGIPWAGHTHFLSHSFPDAIMFFWSEVLKVALFTHHLPLKKAIAKITEESLLGFILRLDENINKIPSHKFRFLISGLNPHAGEQGLMGTEEREQLLPAIKKAQKRGVPISGPFPPDVVFRHGSNKPDIIVIALYHDQGLIPFKLQAFDRGVNVTLGLPFVRTSPDHGTAFDIAGKGIADPKSMTEAIHLAHRFISAK